KQWSAFTSIFEAISSSFFSVARLLWRWSAKTSPSATSLTFLSAWRACVAAPVPRPPQPTRPTRSRSLPAAWTLPGPVKWLARVAPATAAEALRKSRREAGEVRLVKGRLSCWGSCGRKVGLHGRSGEELYLYPLGGRLSRSLAHELLMNECTG